jgi:hypothetical protein
MLLSLCGYRAGQRFVSLCWAGDDLWYDDGVSGGTARWHGFLRFTGDARVAAVLAGYDLFGSDAGEARHRLLVDAVDGVLYVGAAADVERFVRALTRPLEERLDAITAEQLEAFARRAVRTLTADDVHRAMAEEAEQLIALDAWLSARETCP